MYFARDPLHSLSTPVTVSLILSFLSFEKLTLENLRDSPWFSSKLSSNFTKFLLESPRFSLILSFKMLWEPCLDLESGCISNSVPVAFFKSKILHWPQQLSIYAEVFKNGSLTLIIRILVICIKFILKRTCCFWSTASKATGGHWNFVRCCWEKKTKNLCYLFVI